MCESLNPHASACDLIWKWGLYRANQVKMKSLRWALFQMNGILIKWGNLRYVALQLPLHQCHPPQGQRPHLYFLPVPSQLSVHIAHSKAQVTGAKHH